MWIFNPKKKMPKPKKAKALRRKRIADTDIEPKEEKMVASSDELADLDILEIFDDTERS